MNLTLIDNNMGDNKNSTINLTSEYASVTKRFIAFLIDSFFVLIIRTIVFWTFKQFILEPVMIKFMVSFYNQFGIQFTEIKLWNIEYSTFFFSHSMFYVWIIFMASFIASGGLYYIILFNSRWQASLGQRIMGCFMANPDRSKISKLKSSVRYFLSLMPWIISLVLISLVIDVKDKVKLENVFLLFMIIFWYDIALFNKRRLVLHDIFCKTVLFKGKL